MADPSVIKVNDKLFMAKLVLLTNYSSGAIIDDIDQLSMTRSPAMIAMARSMMMTITLGDVKDRQSLFRGKLSQNDDFATNMFV